MPPSAEWKKAHRGERLKYFAEWRQRQRERVEQYEGGRREKRNGWKRQERFEENGVNVNFVAFDGEGSYGMYQLLACSATDKYVAKKGGLSTLDSLGYFRDLIVDGTITPNDALIGFGLSYDFENILRDVSDEDYIALRLGERITYEDYGLKYVNRKFLDVWFRDSDRLYAFRLQDIYPYFQQSFVKACETRGIALPEIVYEGKRNRSSFKWTDIETIIKYNNAELVAMVKLAESLRDDFLGAFRALDITPTVGKTAWYGPGSQAGSVLNVASTEQLKTRDLNLTVATQTSFLQAYRPYIIAHKERHGAVPRDVRSAILGLGEAPFSAAYFGGRIEAAMQGKFTIPLYDYDLTGAYPYAITRLPVLSDKHLVAVRDLDEKERIGAYLIRWDFTSSKPFYPFPFRSRGANVYFPASGRGWVLSPELYGIDHENFRVEQGWVFSGTEGYGRGNRIGDSALARLMMQMGIHRAEAKARDDPAHRGLKLLMNSVYGKTLQKEGSRRFFNALVAAWITSVTRARIYGLIGNTVPGEVISVMTDGVLSTIPLDATLGNELGDWTLTMFDGGYQFAPGVYKLNCMCHGEQSECKVCGGKGFVIHYRGFLKFDAAKAARSLDRGVVYKTANPVFVSRTMAMHNRDVAKKRYQFFPIEREENFSLSSKRNMEAPATFGLARYFPPKSAPTNIIGELSWPYEIYTRRTLDKLLEEEEREVE